MSILGYTFQEHFSNVTNSVRIRPKSELVDIIDLWEKNCTFGNMAIQITSSHKVEVIVEHSVYYSTIENISSTETWFSTDTISVEPNTPVYKQLTVPFCKFLKITLKNDTDEFAHTAINMVFG